MDGLRHDVFTRTRFASDQDAGVRWSNTLEAFDDGFHTVAGVNQILETKSLIHATLQLSVLFP